MNEVPRAYCTPSKRVVGAKQELAPDTVFLNKHQSVVKLPRSVVDRADICVDVWMLPDHGCALAAVGMREVSHDDSDIGKAHGYGVQVTGERAFERRLRDEGRSCVEQYWEAVPSCVSPEVVKLRIGWLVPCIPRPQLDPA